MLYQALIGAWPLEGTDAEFVQRIEAYAIKAAREGKLETSWTNPDEAYEKWLKQFIANILDRTTSLQFLDGMSALARRVALLGALNSLSQLALKATMPGVPDFYQGTELWDLSLVDPDNRRPVDFELRRTILGADAESPDWGQLADDWQDGRIKLVLTRQLLRLRNELAHVFTQGSYRPVEVTGPDSDHVVAFARSQGQDTVIVVVGRHFGPLAADGERWPSSFDWNATVNLAGQQHVRDWLRAGAAVDGEWVAVSRLMGIAPVAILQARAGVPGVRRQPRRVTAALVEPTAS